MKDGRPIRSHHQLEVFNRSFATAMEIFELSKHFPADERFSLTDQIRRSSRSVTANLAEAWRKRRYRAAFVAKLCDVEGEAAETQVWVEYAVKCGYLDADTGRRLYQSYEETLGTVVGMINNLDAWVIEPQSKR